MPKQHLRDYIRENHPELQAPFATIGNANTLAQMVMNTLRFVFGLGVAILETELSERAQVTCEWGHCPQCGQRLQSKGWVGRQMTTLLGQVRWERRVGRCPKRCAIGVIAPPDPYVPNICPSNPPAYWNYTHGVRVLLQGCKIH